MKMRQAYLSSLALEQNNIQKNTNANIIYKQTGETPTKVTDIRSTTDKYAGLEGKKQMLRDTLSGEQIMNSHTAEDLVQNLSENELDFFSQYKDFILKDFKPRNVPAKVFKDYLKRLIKKTILTKGVEYGLQQETGNGILLGQQLLLATAITPEFARQAEEEMRASGCPPHIATEVGNRLGRIAGLFLEPEQRDKLTKILDGQSAALGASILEMDSELGNMFATRDQIEQAIGEAAETGDWRAVVDATDGDLAEGAKISREVRASIESALANEEVVGPPPLGGEEDFDPPALPLENTILDELQSITAREIDDMKRQFEVEDNAGYKRWVRGFESQSLEQKRKLALEAGTALGLSPANVQNATDLQCDFLTLNFALGRLAEARPEATGPAGAEESKGEEGIVPGFEESTLQAELGSIQGTTEDTYELQEYGERLIAMFERAGVEPPVRALSDDRDELLDQLETILRRAYGQRRPTGSGLMKRPKTVGRPPRKKKSAADRSDGYKKPASYKQFGKYLLNHHKLNDGILMIKSASGAAVPKIPTEAISHNLAKVVKHVGTGMKPSLSDFEMLTPDEKKKLHHITRMSRVENVDVPNPTKDAEEKELDRFNILRGEIIAGNDSSQIAREFKALLMKFVREGRIPKRQANEVLEEMLHLG
jgi:hypothetical protein